MIDRSAILDFLVDMIMRTALVFAVFLLFTGHNAPGGGFVGGLVVAIALILRFVARGEEGVEEILPVPPDVLLGGGLALAITTGMGGWLWGAQFLESAKLEVTLPLLGDLKATSALPFDIGVFVVVIGLTAALLLSLGNPEIPE